MITNTLISKPLEAGLLPRTLAGGRVQPDSHRSWRLTIPEGPRGQYRLAQLDDYSSLGRSDFLWRPPLELHLRARCSRPALPGTWGFGFWNDPFSAKLGIAGGGRRLPVLPDAVWFFFASPENYLTLNDRIPASGALSATFSSRRLPSILLAAGLLFLPFLYIRPAARLLRKAAGRIVNQDAAKIPDQSGKSGSVADWREYSIYWSPAEAVFEVDGAAVLNTRIVPAGPLGLVIWIDNQFAALPADGGVSFGSLANPEPAWIEISDLVLRGE
jgi:hypothetical protein